jgi:hypothetical protein
VHAATNTTALSLYGSSLLARRRGAHGRGKLLAAAGAAALTAAGYLGGHLTSRTVALACTSANAQLRFLVR